jgi:hypothetical protein
MKRRKAIGLLLLAGGGTAVSVGGYKWYDWNKPFDHAFLDKKKELLAALADTILPATDTPGAKEAGAGDFISVMVKDCTERKSQNKFIDGLKELEAYCSSNYNKNYVHCSLAEQQAVMRHFQQKGRPMKGIMGKVQNRYLGKSFFTTLKEYTVLGYCTSELGASKGLAYVAVPGRFNGCIPLEKGQKTWATK